jgi:hypothetical protein
MQKNIFKAIAKAKGLYKFFDGIPCKNGHLSERYTRNSGCVQCLCPPKKAKKSVEEIKENLAKYKKQYAITHAERKRKLTKEWALKNPEKALLNAKISQANRRARKLKATPKWANKSKIREIYSNCPVGSDVDHIIPLAGKLVCGLHVENNLQYLDRKENKLKAASFIP